MARKVTSEASFQLEVHELEPADPPKIDLEAWVADLLVTFWLASQEEEDE